MSTIGPNAVAVVPANPERLRTGGSSYPFRQSSDLYYLTGFPEPESVLVLRPGADKERCVLFLRPRDRDREIWDGRRVGIDAAVAEYGVDVAYPIAELEERLPELIANTDELYYDLGRHPELDRRIVAVIAALRNQERRGFYNPKSITDPRFTLHEMRLVKDDAELQCLARAAEITAEAHRVAMREASRDSSEGQLQAAIENVFRKRGGSAPGYQTIVGSGANATILHYVDNNQPLHEGDLVLIDAGCEYQMYTADVTRTFPVSGTFSGPQREVYEVVLSAQKQAIAMAKPGATLEAIHNKCVEVLTEGMVALGLLSGTPDQRIADSTYRSFYMHRTSHWLGMDVHDVGRYRVDGVERPLEPGMVLTVEPGLYVAEDAEAPPSFRGIGVRIEDDVVITTSGCDVLTAAAPKEIADVEAACG